MPKRKSALNEHEQQFVLAFRGKARGNATRAAEMAGYSKKNARSQASRLLTRANVQKALVELLEVQRTGVIADAARRDQVCSDILEDTKNEPTTRLKAIGELNKVEGRHSATLHLKGKLTLADAIMESRRPE